jgi:autotransporter-associated beta strand protein
MKHRTHCNFFGDEHAKMRRIVFAACVGVLMANAPAARASVVDIPAIQDATLLGGSDATTNNSLSDPGIFVGTDGQGNPKRGLILFNVSNALPADAIITNVELELTVGQVAGSGGGVSGGGSAAETMSLYDETQPWGQPTNFVAATTFGGHGHGATPNLGDATWNYAYYGSTAWNVSGGNWTSNSTDLADAQVVGTDNYVATWSSAAMVTDVQHWLANPAANFGWLIKNSDETDSTDFRAFWSWQGAANNNTSTLAPELVVTYTTSATNLVWFGSANANGDGRTWDIGNNSNWNNGTGLVAYTDGAAVTFDNRFVTANQTVILNGSVSPASVTVNNSSGSYTITGTGGISGATSLTKMGSQRLTLATVNNYSGGTVVDGGVLELAINGALPAASTLTIAAGAEVVADANTGLMILNSLNLDPAGTGTAAGLLDLTNNGLVIENGNLATLTADIRAGANALSWNGSAGITSATAASDSTHLTAVGAATGLTTFEGTSVSASDVLLRYTYFGDANLDGVVDGSDYSLIDNGYLNRLTGWQNGDFNYDGIVDGSDYTLIDNTFNTQGAALTSAVVTSKVAVPEPVGVGMIGIVGLAMQTRRRRTN